MRGSRRGSALLDATVALTVLAVAGSALLSALASTRNALHQARTSERAMAGAEQELARLIVLDSSQLDSLTGWSRSGGFALRIRPVGGGLFEATVARREDGPALLQTNIYRRAGGAHASP